MKDKILDIVEEHCVGWKNCKALTEKLFDLYNVSDTLILTPKDAEVFFNEIMNPKEQLSIHDVSQQRELLLAYNEEINQCMVDSQDILEESDVDEFLANNCG